MAAPFQAAVTGQPIKRNTGVIVGGGNVPANRTLVNRSVRANANQLGYASNHVLAVSEATSGNLGTFKPISAAVFSRKPVKNEYLMMGLSTKIAGISNNQLRSCATDVSLFRAIPLHESTRRLNITSWSYSTGAATFGGSSGALSSFGNDHAGRPTNAIPGELVYQTGSNNPTQADYKPRVSP
jgi:hypothetical protein